MGIISIEDFWMEDFWMEDGIYCAACPNCVCVIISENKPKIYTTIYCENCEKEFIIEE